MGAALADGAHLARAARCRSVIHGQRSGRREAHAGRLSDDRLDGAPRRVPGARPRGVRRSGDDPHLLDRGADGPRDRESRRAAQCSLRHERKSPTWPSHGRSRAGLPPRSWPRISRQSRDRCAAGSHVRIADRRTVVLWREPGCHDCRDAVVLEVLALAMVQAGQQAPPHGHSRPKEVVTSDAARTSAKPRLRSSCRPRGRERRRSPNCALRTTRGCSQTTAGSRRRASPTNELGERTLDRRRRRLRLVKQRRRRQLRRTPHPPCSGPVQHAGGRPGGARVGATLSASAVTDQGSAGATFPRKRN
jgi:hypothetical protein